MNGLLQVLLVALSVQAQLDPRQSVPQPDLILVNGRIVTMDRGFSIQEGLAVNDGKVLAVGRNADIRALAGPSTRVLDLAGRTVLPGLQDSHIHFLELGRDIKYQAELTFCRTAQDILRELSQLKARLKSKPDEWIIGNRWDQYKYPEMVTRWQLDELAPENPVRLNRVYRGVAVNTAVFKLMGIQDERPDTWPSWWLKDPAGFTFEDKIFRSRRTLTIDGRARELDVPTGAFVGSKASALVTARPPRATFDEDVESVRLGCQEMLRLGVTAVVDPSSAMGYHMRVLQEAYNRGDLAIRMAAVYEGTFFTHPPEEMRKHFDAIKINNLGDALLRWRGAKFYADGGAGTRSAWLSEPFARSMELEGKPNLGNPVVEDNGLREAQYRAALAYGWELHTHACGDQAMRQTMDQYARLIDEIHATRPKADLRWSIIHAYLPLEEKTRVLADMARYGVIACVNPVFNWQEGAAFASNLGPERLARTQPFRSYMKGGVVLASGSDYGVTSHNPWMGLYALLTRRDQTSGKVYGPDETLGIADALRTYTTNGAFLTYDEKTRGSLEAGKAADLVVVDIPDIRELEKNPELCLQMADKVRLTMVAGQIRYERK